MRMEQTCDIELRAETLLAQMTLEEKVGQLNQQPLTNDISALEQGVRSGAVGSVVLAYTPFAGREHRRDQTAQRERLQRIAQEESRLGIPLLLGRDVLHGHHTVFPIPLAQAAAWDPALAGRAAELAAAEAAQDHVNLIFAPMADVCRDLRWGRVVEGYGEDPFLSGRYARSAVEGFQRSGAISACVKHFLAYGGVEGGRDYSGVDASQRQLRGVYLPPFAQAVAAGTDCVMAAFNDVNGVPVTASAELLTGLLKGELGFSGIVVSDWNAIGQLVAQGAAEDRRDAARLAFLAGVDVDMCSGCYAEHLAGLVRDGVCPEARLDDAVRRVLRVKLRRQGLRPAPPARKEAASAALELAQKSIVLLKNRGGVLPLSPGGSVALIGAAARQRRIHLGSWTLDGRAERTASIAQALRGRREVVLSCCDDPQRARRAAAQAETTVVVLGEHWDHTGEARGSAALSLPEGQLAALRAAASSCRRVVAVVCAGRALCLSEAERYADAILCCWHGGVQAAQAIVSVLCGDVCPSGKLPISLPRHVGQIPLCYSQRTAARNIDSYYGPGDIASYLDCSAAPLYPFGWGLSYAAFSYGPVSARWSGDRLCLEAAVRSTGARTAQEVCPGYIQPRGAGRAHPARLLRGFQRVELAPGEERTVRFTLGPEELSAPDETGRDRLWPSYAAWIGGDCLTTNQTVFRIKDG